MDETPEPTGATMMEWLSIQIGRERNMIEQFMEEASRSSVDHREHCLFAASRAEIRQEAFIDVMFALKKECVA